MLLELASQRLSDGTRITATFPIRNADRAVGTMLGSYITRAFGADGLPPIRFNLHSRDQPVRVSARLCPAG